MTEALAFVCFVLLMGILVTNGIVLPARDIVRWIRARHASVDQRHDEHPSTPHNHADAGIRSPSTPTGSTNGGKP